MAETRTNQKWQRHIWRFFHLTTLDGDHGYLATKDVTILVQYSLYRLYTAFTELGALFLLGKDRRILILAPDMSKNKAPTSVPWNFSF